MTLLMQNANVFKTHTEVYKAERLNGKDYIVAPVVAIVAGVLNGELVPVEEIAHGHNSWNGRPVTLDHPNIDGLYVTANHPDTWDKYVIGQLFNVEFCSDRLKGEIWIDVELAAGTDDGQLLLKRLDVADPIEVSTAYFRDLDPLAGELDGIPYQGVAQDLKPDHLAILLHSAGACSWADGCGVPRLNQQEVKANMPDTDKLITELEDTTILEPTPNEEPGTTQEQDADPASYSWWEKFKAGARNALFGAEDGTSLEEQWDAVVSAFYRLIESGQPVGEVGDGYVMQVYPEHIIVERLDGTLFQIAYIVDDDGVEFGAQVEGRMTFQPNQAEDVTSETDSETEMETETPAGNEDADEDPAANVDAESEEPETEIDPEPTINDEDADQDSEAEDNPPEETTTNETQCQEYVELVEFAGAQGGPDWALQTLQNVVKTKTHARQELIALLVANEACAFTAEDLKGMDVIALTKLQLTLDAPKANYAGQLTPAKPDPEGETDKRRTIELPPMRG